MLRKTCKASPYLQDIIVWRHPEKVFLEENGLGPPMHPGCLSDRLPSWFHDGKKFWLGLVCLPDETTAGIHRWSKSLMYRGPVMSSRLRDCALGCLERWRQATMEWMVFLHREDHAVELSDITFHQTTATKRSTCISWPSATSILTNSRLAAAATAKTTPFLEASDMIFTYSWMILPLFSTAICSNSDTFKESATEL